ncbi:MAG TPA: DUF5134 domain-containing protein [Acidimicrobiales bacterium]|nr:DUF5134 domain-containing protein [Acidimicrobiales bacterium]
MASGPFALLLAVAMIGVASFHASRLALALARRGSTEVDVDVVHLVMGVSMAGMLTGWLTGAWNDAWILVFTGSTVWFSRGILGHLADAKDAGRAVTHHLPHLVVSAVMLFMLLAMRWTSMTGSEMRSMAGVRDVGGSLVLPAVLAVLVVGNASIVAWRAFVPSLAGAAAPDMVPSPAPAPAGVALPAGVRSRRTTSRTGAMLAPRGAPACLLVMSVAMAYMVVSLHP